MKKKYSIILDDEFVTFCELNNITNIQKTATDVFNRGFTILKYGEVPFTLKSQEKIITKEVIVEIPVEKIIEKEVIKEIIKEVPIISEPITVIKEVNVDNNHELEKLKEENKKLKEQIESINTTLDKFNKAKYLKNSDLNSLYDE